MRKLFYNVLLSTLLSVISFTVFAQGEAVIPPSNRSTTSMEKNVLFYADKRFNVSQSGSASLNLAALFDGNFSPQYSGGINASDPYVILIKDLPHYHSQAGSWVGWTTRYYSPVRFKIEAYNVYGGANTWVTVVDVNDNHQGSFIVQLPQLAAAELRFTFYQGEGPSGSIGLSELFYINPEATSAYDGMMVKYNANGNVGIGADATNEKLAVNGNIRAKEIKVETANWPDYVFNQDYKILGLQELDAYIKSNKHLPEMPSANEIEANGMALGEMIKLQQKKIEELTLHLIEKDKQLVKETEVNTLQENTISAMQKEFLQLKQLILKTEKEK